MFFVYPETAHRTLEELGEAFGDRVHEDTVPELIAATLAVPETSEAKSGSSGSSGTLRGSMSEMKDVTGKTVPAN